MGQNNLFSSFKNAANALVPAMSGKQGEVWHASRHGGRYLQTYSGLCGFTQAIGQITTVGLATTYTGLCLSNPAASTVNLVLMNVTGGYNVSSTAINTIGLATGYSAAGVVTHTVAGTVYNSKIGVASTALQGLADTACTLVGTPVWTKIFANVITTTVAGSYFNYDAMGEIILPPGAWCAIVTNAVSAAAGLYATMSWEEVAP